MKTLLIFVLCALACACATAPKLPATVPVTVTEFRPLPDWAKEKVSIPVLRDGTVEAHLVREDALESIVKVYLCKTDLLIQLDLDLDQKVDPEVCKKL